MIKVGTLGRLLFLILIPFCLATVLVGYFCTNNSTKMEMSDSSNQKMITHLVLIQFKATTTEQNIQQITDGAYSLQAIPGVKKLNFGKNISPEGLGRGYTHSLTMKFSTTNDRDSVYLPHPIHQKFVRLFVPFTESVLVYDFWE